MWNLFFSWWIGVLFTSLQLNRWPFIQAYDLKWMEHAWNGISSTWRQAAQLWLLTPEATIPEASALVTQAGLFLWVAPVCMQTSVKSSILKHRQWVVAKWQPWKLLENSEFSVSPEMPLFSSQLPLNWHPALSPHKHPGVWDPVSWEKGGLLWKA